MKKHYLKFFCAIIVLVVLGLFPRVIASAEDVVGYYNGSDIYIDEGCTTKVTDSSTVTSIVVKNGVTTIGDYAFRYCDNLESIEIPNSVTSIGDSAFFGCDSLESIEIPNSVTSIGDSAFYNCKGLKSITIPGSVTSLDSSFLKQAFPYYVYTDSAIADSVTDALTGTYHKIQYD